MARWSWLVGILLILVVGMPLLFPFVDLLSNPRAWQIWTEADRLLALCRNTGLLVVGTVAIAVPFGVLGAFLFFRSDLPLRGIFRFAVIVTLFVPLPLFASGWQATLGSGGWLPVAAWDTPTPDDPDYVRYGPSWKPWAQGLNAAIWVHALAAIPWVVLIVGQGLSWVERELEEDARLATTPGGVFLHVTLRRSMAAIGIATIWVAMQTTTEITVTDMMIVRTFAEEVYSQFTRPEPGFSNATTEQALARALAVNIPQIVLSFLLASWGINRWERTIPPLRSRTIGSMPFKLGRARWLFFIVTFLVAGIASAVPIASLIWKAGLAGSPREWSLHTVTTALRRVLQSDGKLLTDSVLSATSAGIIAATLALATCWLAMANQRFRTFALGLTIAAWAVPGPLIGLGLKAAINLLMILEDHLGVPKDSLGPIRFSLYEGPSILPIVWAYVVRGFPFAMALLWPVVRLVPVDLRDAARVDGASPFQLFRYVIWPLTKGNWLQATLVASVISLGEVSASKLVATPNSSSFTHEVFVRMHFGVTSDLAALCLIVLLAVFVGGSAVALAIWLTNWMQARLVTPMR